MLNVSGILYFGSRAIAAAGNLLAVMIFTRLAGPAEYGQYVLIYAWSLIVYGFGAQWVRFAFFGVYHQKKFYEYAASLARLLGCGLVIVAAILTGLGLFGLFEPRFLVAVFALVCGITFYEAAFEVARTGFHAGAASLSMILRTALTVLCGSVSLWLQGGARGLALAIAVAHVIAAIPSLSTIGGIRISHASRATSLQILGYGWPLLLAFGINAAGQSIDRLLLAHYLGPATLGPYGVVADLIRQCFTVCGEAIILSVVTVAKRYANEGNREAADATLLKAFNGCLATACFGAAFFVVFGEIVLRALLKPEFIAPTRDLIPIFAVAFAFITMRSYYFAQVIYFTRASFLELAVCVLFLVTSVALSLLLVPTYGPHGAAFALMISCMISCIAFAVLGRRWYRLPIDFTALAVMPSLAILFMLGARATAQLIPSGSVPVIIDAAVFTLLGYFAISRFGVLTTTLDVAIPERVTTG